ncbi:MAG: transposase [Mariprofundaceae bacterium]|nr:transposase [Mariprofundaceae bacterium]
MKDHKSGFIINPFTHLGKKRMELLNNSWAEVFRLDVLPYLPVDELSAHYSKDQGRPTKELYSVMGLMVLQQMHNLDDEEAVNQFCFNIQWHYALNITDTDDAHAYICPRTLWEMRALMSKYSLDSKALEVVTKHLADIYDLDTNLQRLDSTHLFSNMRSLGRVSLFVTTIKRFLKNLKRQHSDSYSILDKDLCKRYMTAKGDAAFASTTPEHAGRKLVDLAQDLWALIHAFSKQDEISTMTSYKHLVRLFHDQCDETNVDDTKTTKKGEDDDPSESISDIETEHANDESVAVKPKAGKEISGDSLQNPSDPDATYDGHKGVGYQVQIMETCTESAGEKALSLITHVSVEPAHIHDSHALIPAIKQAIENGLGPKRVLADAAYGSDDNSLDAAELGVELISPVLGNPKDGQMGLESFTCGDNGHIILCSQSHSPIQNSRGKKGGYSAMFSSQQCAECPMLESCRVQEGKKGFYLRYTAKEMRLAKRRRHEKGKEFRSIYAMRSGIEASNSEAKQTTGLGRLRVRGLKAMTFAVTMKLLGVNVRRTAAFKFQKIGKNSPDSDGNDSKSISFSHFMRQIYVYVVCEWNIWRKDALPRLFSFKTMGFRSS